MLPAVAAQRAKHVAGETLGMDADERRLRMDIAVDKSDGFFAPRIGPSPALKAHNAEMAPTRGEIGFGNLAD